MPLTPTAEQVHARDLFATGEDLAIQAGAGTGKTASLVLLAEQAAPKGRSGRYMVFNKALSVDAEKRMPPNVAVSTAHALAFRAVARPYAHRLRSGRMKSQEIARILGIDPFTVRYGQQVKTLAAGWIAGLAMRTAAAFCSSADQQVHKRHVPYIDGIDPPSATGKRTYDNNNQLAEQVVPYASKIWADWQRTDGVLPYRHDAYLKTYEMSRPRIGVDFILFDEVQDATPVLASIVMQQEDTQLVVVGDEQQAIYGWNGCINVFEEYEHEHVAFLSRSFRFGDAVADVANGVLAELDAELRLEGNPAIHSTVGPVTGPRCILTRTNGRAVSIMLQALAEGRRPHLVGGGDQVIGFARGARDLQEGRRTTYPDLACFESWGEVQAYVEEDENGVELRMLVQLIDDYGAQAVIQALERQPPEASADLVVSTAHKSKGREWDSVRLGSDFAGKDGDREMDDLADEEKRLLYVAVTRARHQLDLSAVSSLVSG